MATDLRSGKDFPRRGRDEYGGYMWILRAFDKARAAADGTIHDYIYPCPMDKGVFERVSPAQREAANDWLRTAKASNLDRQDSEEGVVAA